MKPIRVLVSGTINVGTTPVCVNDALELAKQARKNRAKVIEGALTIENAVSEIIAHYFFEKHCNQRTVFEELILNSQWCSFSAKRAVLSHIVREKALLGGSEHNNFEQLLRKVLAYRNAFTHGSLDVRNNATTVWLSYFEGGPRCDELSDEFLTKVEETLLAANNVLHSLAVTCGATKEATPPDGPV